MYILTSGYPSHLALKVQILCYSACVLLLGINWLLRRKYLQELGLGLLLMGHFFWFAAPASYQVLSSNTWFGSWSGIPVSDEALSKACLQISVFLLMNGLFYHLVAKKDEPLASYRRLKTRLSRGVRIVLILMFLTIGVLPYLFTGSNISNLLTEITAGRGDKAWVLSPGSADAYVGNATNTFFWLTRAFLISSGVLAGTFLVLRRQESTRSNAAYLLALLISVFTIFFDQGTRGYMAILLIPILAIWAIESATTQGNSFRAVRKLFVRLIILGIGLLLLTQAQLLTRINADLSFDTADSLLSLRSQNDFFTETAYGIEVKDSGVEITYESPILLFLVNPIPRFLWPEKPRSEVIWSYSFYRWRGHDIWEKGGNALPSVVGQYYLIGGSLGVIWIGSLFGLLAGWLGNIAQGRTIESFLFSVSGLAVLFMSFRWFGPGLHYSTVVLALVAIFASQNESQHEA